VSTPDSTALTPNKRSLSGAWRRATAIAPTPLHHCPNCGSALALPTPNYCGECGQETQIKAPTLMEFMQQFGGSYIAMEGALWRTLWRLLLLPGQLTLEYFAGRRRRYVLPLRLYLTISVLALVLLRVTTSMQVEKLENNAVKFDESERSNFQLNVMGLQAGLKNGEFFCHHFPDSMCKRLERRFKADPQTMAAEIREAPARFIGHLGTAMFLLLPAYALWLKLAFIDKRRRYTEHLVFALHLHAFWFAMLMLMLASIPLLSQLAPLACLIYPLIALARVYRSRWWSTALRAFVIVLLYLSTVTLALALVAVWTVLT